MKILAHPGPLLALALLLSSSSLVAQHGSGKGGGGAAPALNPSTPPGFEPRSTEGWFDPYRRTSPEDAEQRLKNEEPPCFAWPMSPVVSGVVSVDRLDIPVGARQSFSDACAAVLKKDFSAAQHELNQAIKLAPKLAPAWVLLGQTQKEQKKIDKALESCMQAQNLDASYLPAYLCLADLAAHQNNWARTAELTNQALAMHPVRAPGAYYLNALADFYLGQASQAEKSALVALKDGGPEQKPPLHWLLAKIYEARGDRVAEADHLREYLKTDPHAPDAAAVRQILKQIEKQGPNSSSSTVKPPG